MVKVSHQIFLLCFTLSSTSLLRRSSDFIFPLVDDFMEVMIKMNVMYLISELTILELLNQSNLLCGELEATHSFFMGHHRIHAFVCEVSAG